VDYTYGFEEETADINETILGNKSVRFSYQAGFRIEDTRIGTELFETGEKNKKEYLNLFPSGHFAYELPGENTLQVSYSRRINRPYYRLLSPFYNFINPYYLRTGNPDLDPEFTHSMELGYMKSWKIASLSSAIYYRHSDGVIQRIQTVNDEGVMIARPENLSIERSYGVELIYSMDPFSWWNLNGKGTASIKLTDLFNARIYRGVTLGENFYIEQEYRRRTRMVQIGFTYRLNQDKKRGGRNGGGMGGGGDMDF
jgi:outer membrane receptor protein involved in Fe transport